MQNKESKTPPKAPTPPKAKVSKNSVSNTVSTGNSGSGTPPFGKKTSTGGASGGDQSSGFKKKTTSGPPDPCGLCNDVNHRIYKCPQFEAMSTEERKKTVAGLKLCFNCLQTGHRASKCKSTYTCRTCQAKHHTMVHAVAEGESS